MLSAICFNLDQSKILSSGNGLKRLFIKMDDHNSWLQGSNNELLKDGWLNVLGLNVTLIGEVISWRSVTHTRFLAFSHQY